MKTTIQPTILAAALVGAVATSISAEAGEIGHYAGGLMNLRDYLGGQIGLVYMPWHTSLTCHG